MANQLRTQQRNPVQIKTLLIWLVISFAVMVIAFLALFTDVLAGIGFQPYGTGAVICLFIMGASVLSFCGLSIWILLFLTRNRTWAHKVLLTVRTALVILLIAVYVTVGILVWNHFLAMFGVPHRHPDIRLSRFAADGGVVIYICDAQGNFIVDENGNYVWLYLKDDDKNGHVVKDALGRLITTDEDPLIAGAEDGVFYDPFEPKNGGQ